VVSREGASLGFALGLAACGAAQQPDPAAELAALLARSQEAAAADAAGDARRLAHLFADDAVVQLAGAPQFHGRNVLRAYFEERFDAGLQQEPIEFRAYLEVAGSGDLAYEYGQQHALPAGDATAALGRGKYLAVWRKIDGDWYIAALSFTGDAAPPPPAARGP
jgi:uncharacterized protein (TIGR02246 family)